ncbi:MAG: hypothetical protein HKP30_07055 [Myxococcales bacterium]|nr:hypothetical protein [Myxococcales bacterium]
MGLHHPNPAVDAAPVETRSDGDCRCRCGSLVARVVAGGVEIKCRRCKRNLLVPWSANGAWVTPVEAPPAGRNAHGARPLQRASGGER